MRRVGGNCQRSQPSIQAHYLPFVCTGESCLTQQCKQMGNSDLEWKAMRGEERIRREGGTCTVVCCFTQQCKQVGNSSSNLERKAIKGKVRMSGRPQCSMRSGSVCRACSCWPSCRMAQGSQGSFTWPSTCGTCSSGLLWACGKHHRRQFGERQGVLKTRDTSLQQSTGLDP